MCSLLETGKKAESVKQGFTALLVKVEEIQLGVRKVGK